MEILLGVRIAREGHVLVGCSAVVFDDTRERILLTQRADNRQWCLPGGQLEPGESVAEACLRELHEETGLIGQVKRLIGVYSSPDRLLCYPDGNRYHLIGLSFEVELVGGVPGLSDETTAFGYYTANEIASLDLLITHRERIADAFANLAEAVVR